MKRKRQVAAMIIAMGLGLAAAPPVFSAEGELPDPVAFAVALELGDVTQARTWLDRGLPPDFLGSRVGTGLMLGAWEGNLEMMALFLERGADINRLNASGESALALAAWRGQKAAVEWLLARGAKVDAPARHWSALHYAVFAGHGDLADQLMARGADINALTPNGSSVLMMAAREGREELARKLIEKGADRSPKNDWGDGALEWAMRYDRLNIARMVSQPEEFKIAISKPKESWGEPQRSLQMSSELESLLSIRQVLAERKLSTAQIDQRIAAERVRLVRAEMDRAAPPRATALEITASRKNPQAQSAKVVDQAVEPGRFKVPPATFSGKPRMPPKAPVKNY